MRKSKTSVALFVVLTIICCVGERAPASLFASFSLNQALYENGGTFQGSRNEITPFTGTAPPFQTTVTQTTATNSISATYSAYDTGTAAGFSINSSGYTTAAENDVEEGTASGIVPNDNSDTTFSFTQAVNYTISYQITGTNPTGTLEVSYPYQYVINDPELFSSYSKSGTLQPNVIYDLTEQWGITNADFGGNNLAGTDSLNFTFTAIPEPSSLSLLLVPVALLALCRRRGSSVRA